MKGYYFALGLVALLYILDWRVWFLENYAVRCNCGNVVDDELGNQLRVFEDFIKKLPE